MSEVTRAPKEIIVELIDAYAAAKMSGNDALVKMSILQIQTFFNTHEVVALEENNDD